MLLKIKNVQHGLCIEIIEDDKRYFFDFANSPDEEMEIEHLIISHLHLDHYEGLKQYDLTRIKNITISSTEQFELIDEDLLDDEAKTVIKKLNEIIWHNSNSISGSFNNHTVFEKTDENDLNAFSIVWQVEIAPEKWITIFGDNTIKQQEQLLNNIDFMDRLKQSSVIVAPHHGRSNFYCDDLMANTNPEVFVFSDKNQVHETNTDNTKNYGKWSKGCIIDGKERKVLTTRNDGEITIYYNNGLKYELGSDEVKELNNSGIKSFGQSL